MCIVATVSTAADFYSFLSYKKSPTRIYHERAFFFSFIRQLFITSGFRYISRVFSSQQTPVLVEYNLRRSFRR